MKSVRRVHALRKATPVFVGLGSNIRPVGEIRRCLDRLANRFGALTVSPAYSTEAVGFDGPAFINLVVRFETTMSLADVSFHLAAVEGRKLHGRHIGKSGSRVIDVDLLMYGSYNGIHGGISLPRADIAEFAYVLWPLSDIAPDVLHPVLNSPFRIMRNTFSSPQPLRRRVFSWRGRILPVKSQFRKR